MGRRCSYCGNVGHNSRTCTMMQKMRGGGGHVGHGGVRLFGVQLLANLSFSSSSSSSTSSLIATSKIKSCSMDCLDEFNPEKMSSNNNINGYLNHGALTPLEQERNKGMPWSEEEHRMFLIGLHKLGKGDWRGISRNFVTTRTSTQVASHAQKYFLRQNHNLLNKRKRRPSLFDEDKDELFLAQLINADNITSNNIANEAAASTKSNKIPYGFSTKAMSTINGVQYSTKCKCKCDTAKVGVIGETFNEWTTSFNISQQPTTISSTLTHQHQKLPSHLDPIRAGAAAAEEAEVPDLELKLAALLPL